MKNINAKFANSIFIHPNWNWITLMRGVKEEEPNYQTRNCFAGLATQKKVTDNIVNIQNKRKDLAVLSCQIIFLLLIFLYFCPLLM